MPVYNSDIARIFDEIADLLELQAANPFRIRAYRQAARMLSEQPRDIRAMIAQGADLKALPGVGTDLADKITEIATYGNCALLDRLRAETPVQLRSLLRLPQMGPKRVRTLHEELGIQTPEQLHAAALAGRIQTVHGFGTRLQQQLLDATAIRHALAPRHRLSAVDAIAASMLAALRTLPSVERAEVAGSVRRRQDSIGDLDLLVQSEQGKLVIDRFTRHDSVRNVLSAGATRASVVLKSGLQIDLRVVPAASFGAAWVYFTGAKAHDVALRRLAQRRGLKINEYGVFDGGKLLAGHDEASVYAALGLPLIAPELRENRGELAAAQRGRLPRLIERADLRGDLHAHTTQSDGHDDMQALVNAARARGLSYMAVTDHSRRFAATRGLDSTGLTRQMDRIDELNADLKDFRLLKGIEVDILESGHLDLPDSILQRLDLVVGAVHHRFDLPRSRQTERVLRAMDHKHFSMLAHPTGRLIAERGGLDIDLPRVIRHARDRGCFLELNAQPARLDLDDSACLIAKAEGVMVSINSDAHSARDLDNLTFGIDQARRGWLTAADVLNTLSIDQLRPLLARTML